MQQPIPFCRPYLADTATAAVAAALQAPSTAGGGAATARCHEKLAGTPPTRPFLTTSCTAALEMAALLLDLQPGDEVVMPSWTFASTANAVVLRGAVPVFVDVQQDRLGIDPLQAERALTPRTRAVLCVHYAGIACDLDALLALCAAHDTPLIEDAAHGYGATWQGRPLGSVGALGALSFHATKNVSVGEGGALLVNRPALHEAAERMWEKGTDRARFLRGEVSAYEWQTVGSSFLPSEPTAAWLAVQLEAEPTITARRRQAWARYAGLLEGPATQGRLLLLQPPPEAAHNGHIFSVQLPSRAARDRVLAAFRDGGIDARPHYAPLHLSAAGRRYGHSTGPLPVTAAAAAGLVRLPLDPTISEAEQARVVATLLAALD